MKLILAAAPRGSVLGPTLYHLYTADTSTTSIIAEDAVMLASHHNLQKSLNKIQNGAHTGGKANIKKIVQIGKKIM